MDPGTTFENLYAKMLNDETLKLKNPSVSTEGGKTLFMSGKALRAMYEEDFKKPISDLFDSETKLKITDPKVLGKGNAKIKVVFEQGAIYVPPAED